MAENNGFCSVLGGSDWRAGATCRRRARSLGLRTCVSTKLSGLIQSGKLDSGGSSFERERGARSSSESE